MRGRPEPGEAAAYYSRYTDHITSDDILAVLHGQLEELTAFWSSISEERSRYRYAADKWSIRQVLSHISDSERVFQYRALWFARGYTAPLPSFDEKVAAQTAGADDIAWARHVAEFRAVRTSSLTLFQNLPHEAWMRSGTASDNLVTVRALAYIIAGHVAHHVSVLHERYGERR